MRKGPRPNTSKPHKGDGHHIYPYLLRGLSLDRPNQIWAMDISYIPVAGGHMYLVAIIDVYSRYIVGWSLSNTMTAQWCRECLEGAIMRHGVSEILNTDQGSQFSSPEFSGYGCKYRNVEFLKSTREDVLDKSAQELNTIESDALFSRSLPVIPGNKDYFFISDIHDTLVSDTRWV